jgi:hypothetical protein
MTWSLSALWAWVERFAHARGAVPGTFLWNLSQGSVVPGPSELLMLPLGIVYFTLATVGLALGGVLAATPIIALFGLAELNLGDAVSIGAGTMLGAPIVILLSMLGVMILFGTLHLAKGVAKVHGAIAKNLLVKWGD